MPWPAANMIIIAGLGNPGEKFANTRHNIGREVVFAFARSQDFPEFRVEKKWNALVSEHRVGRASVVLLAPETFMNKSGQALAPALRFYKVKPDNFFLIHDDADLPFGKAKLSFGRGAAGHKGVESVMRFLKTKDFWRWRIGIAGRKDIPAEKIVLKKFTPEEMRAVKKIMKETLESLKTAVEESPEKAMNSYNAN